MRIGILTASFLPMVGGMEWKVHYLASEYVQAGHDVVVFAIRHRVRRKHLQLPIPHAYKVVRTGLTARGFGRLGINRFLSIRSIRREHRRRPIDLLHCHPLGPLSYWGAIVGSVIKVPVVATTSGADVMVEKSLNYGDRLLPHVERMLRYCLNHLDVIVCVSQAIREALEELGGTARLVNIPNGVAWNDFQVERSHYLHERLQLDEKCIVVLSVGRYTPIKDYSSTLRAFAKVKHQYPNSVLVILGRGVSCLSQEAERLGLNNALHLIEQVPISEVPKIMRSADIFLNTSLMEGFAQANAQALACGLPCVLTDSPGNVDASIDGGALVARTADADSISENLGRLISDPDLRRVLGKSAHEAGKKYDWKIISRDYLDIFEELTAKVRH